MRVVKNINNNVSLCLDAQGHEVIVFGKGVGFVKPPHQIALKEIERTFYDLDLNYLEIISTLSFQALTLAGQIVNYANSLTNQVYAANLVISLADHIDFALKREREEINLKLPLYYDLKTFYPTELKIGRYALKLINAQFYVNLPSSEAAIIALHLIDYQNGNSSVPLKHESVIDQCCRIIETALHFEINRNDFSYARFVTHMYFLLNRLAEKQDLHIGNDTLFKTMIREYPEIHQCACQIAAELALPLGDDEIVYLMIHINRLLARQ